MEWLGGHGSREMASCLEDVVVWLAVKFCLGNLVSCCLDNGEV
jgi:hypothetical protein